MRCSGTVTLAAAACSMDVIRVWGRYTCFWLCMQSRHAASLSHYIYCHKVGYTMLKEQNWLEVFETAGPRLSQTIYLQYGMLYGGLAGSLCEHQVACNVMTLHTVMKVGKGRRGDGSILLAQIAPICTASNWHPGGVWDGLYDQPRVWPGHCCGSNLLDRLCGAACPGHPTSCSSSQPHAHWQGGSQRPTHR